VISLFAALCSSAYAMESARFQSRPRSTIVRSEKSDRVPSWIVVGARPKDAERFTCAARTRVTPFIQNANGQDWKHEKIAVCVNDGEFIAFHGRRAVHLDLTIRKDLPRSRSRTNVSALKKFWNFRFLLGSEVEQLRFSEDLDRWRFPDVRNLQFVFERGLLFADAVNPGGHLDLQPRAQFGGGAFAIMRQVFAGGSDRVLGEQGGEESYNRGDEANANLEYGKPVEAFGSVSLSDVRNRGDGVAVIFALLCAGAGSALSIAAGAWRLSERRWQSSVALLSLGAAIFAGSMMAIFY